jgi:hypothetical protein
VWSSGAAAAIGLPSIVSCSATTLSVFGSKGGLEREQHVGGGKRHAVGPGDAGAKVQA